MSEATCRKS